MNPSTRCKRKIGVPGTQLVVLYAPGIFGYIKIEFKATRGMRLESPARGHIIRHRKEKFS